MASERFSVETDTQLQNRITNVIYSLNILSRFLSDGVMPSEVEELEPVITEAIREIYRLRADASHGKTPAEKGGE